MSSLRERLLLWLLSALVLVGVVVGLLIYRAALAQANEAFDSQLQQTAFVLRNQAFEYGPRTPLLARHLTNDLVVQVWSDDGVRIYFSDFHAVLPGLARPGLHTVETRDGAWRVFTVLAPPARIIQVSQPIQVRQRQAGRFALATLQPFLWLMPLLAALVWIVVGRELAPLRGLAEVIRGRPADSLSPLPLERLPDEVQPLVQALNELLGRLSGALTRERAFLADAAHELRTPLTALRLQTESLERARTDSERQRAATQLTSGVQRAIRLAEQLLSLARHESATKGQWSEIALDELAREVISEHLDVARLGGVDLGMAESQRAVVRGEPEALRTLMRNLIDNAVRYTPRGGRIDVGVTEEIVQGGDPIVTLTVTDDGPGIPAQERERVFDRFHRVPGTVPTGSGLGLAIVRSIARAHDAEVVLEDAPGGHGLRVRVRFLRVT